LTNFGFVQEFQRKFNCSMDMSSKSESASMILEEFGKKLDAMAVMLLAAGPTDGRMRRARLICEETGELLRAMAKGDRVEIAKEAADVHYVVYGTEDAYDIPADQVFCAVHCSNMSKTQDRDSGGKILKGPDYKAPNIKQILEDADAINTF